MASRRLSIGWTGKKIIVEDVLADGNLDYGCLKSLCICRETNSEEMSLVATSCAGLSGTTIEEKTRNILGWTTATGPINHHVPSTTPPSIVGDCLKTLNAPGLTGSARRKSTVKKSCARFTTTVTPYPMDGRKLSGGGPAALRHQLTPPPSPVVNGGLLGSSGLMSGPNSRKTSFEVCSPYSYSCSPAALPISPISPNTQQPHFFASLQQQAASPHQTASPSTSAASGSGGDPKVFERLRQLVPSLSADKDAAYRLFTKLVSNVIDLEHQLESLQEQTRGAEMAYAVIQQQPLQSPPAPLVMVMNTTAAAPLQNPMSAQPLGQQLDSPSSSSCCSSSWSVDTVPDDLSDVDVSAFKCLVDTPASFFAPTTGVGGGTMSGSAPFFQMPMNPMVDQLTVDTTLCC